MSIAALAVGEGAVAAATNVTSRTPPSKRVVTAKPDAAAVAEPR